MKKTKLIFILFVFFASVFVCFFLRSRPDKLCVTPSSKTYVIISDILDDFDAVGVEDTAMQKLVVSLEQQTNSYSINQCLASFLAASTNNLRGLQGLNLKNGLLYDAWGTPICFALTNKLAVSSLVYLATNSHPRPFVIWSAGPNCSNEWGAGDDLLIIGR